MFKVSCVCVCEYYTLFQLMRQVNRHTHTLWSNSEPFTDTTRLNVQDETSAVVHVLYHGQAAEQMRIYNKRSNVQVFFLLLPDWECWETGWVRQME